MYIALFFIRVPIDRHLGCYDILATINIAIIDMGMQVSLWKEKI